MSWHDYVALALIAAAGAAVFYRTYRALLAKPSAGCGSGCGSCGNSAATAKPGSLVSIGSAPVEPAHPAKGRDRTSLTNVC
jgi:hypothetical protein